MKKKFKTKIFADGANISEIITLNQNKNIKGFTTNPTLMRKAGVDNYEKFCKKLLIKIKDKPISFEVFADDFDEIIEQAKKINSWGENVYVKVPVMNTKREHAYKTIKKLSNLNIKLNITAIFTKDQIKQVVQNLNLKVPAYISVFAGRIADAGVNPLNIMRYAVDQSKKSKNFEVIWASPRQSYNIIEADEIGCHIITITKDILNKIDIFGKDLEEYSLDTVKMFYKDALEANYKI
jgi:transaldolase